MIYLDNNATTGVDPLVLDAMLQELNPIPSNPSSVHKSGRAAFQRLLKARETIARYFQVKTQEIIFTSGGTESLNMMIRSHQGHCITTDVEHSAVYQTVKGLKTETTYLSVSDWGAAKVEQVEAALRPNTSLIVLTAVNSETGVKTDIEAIAQLALMKKIPFVVDGVALLGKESFKIVEGIAGMAFSGHKLHGPKGVGIAFIRSSFKVPPLITGGDQEYSKRAGTENLPGIMGLAKAIELLSRELPQATERMRMLRDRFEKGLKEKLGEIIINGEGPRVCNTSNLSFPGIEGETLLMALDMAGIAASHGSACASGALEPSRVLTNMGLSKERVRSSVRFSLSRWTTQEEIDQAIEIIVKLVLKKEQ